MFDHGFLGLGIGITFLCLVLGAGPGLLAAGVHAVSYLLLSAAVNAVGHRFGRRPFPNLATNSQLLALLTAGEGLRSNHHAAPTSARFSHGRGELDLGWLAIRALRRLSWATVRHDRPALVDDRESARAA